MTKDEAYQKVLNNKKRLKKEELDHIVRDFVIKFNKQVDRWGDTKFYVFISEYYGHNNKTEIYKAIANHNVFYTQFITKIEISGHSSVYVYCDLRPSLFQRIKTYLTKF